MLVNNVGLYSGNLARHIPLAFRDPDSTLPYQVKSITGLDADEIVNKFVGNPEGGPGYYIPSVKRPEVVILLGLNPWTDPDDTYSSLRDNVWKLVSSSLNGTVKLYFNLDAVTKAALTGSVKKVETVLFDQKPTIQLTIDCSRDPALRAVNPVAVNVEGLLSGSTFSVNNELSTAIHGFKFALEFNDASSSFSISGAAGWEFKVTYPFHGGDKLYFSSETNNKYIYIARGGNLIQMADKVSASSIWAMMLPGINQYQVHSSHGVDLTALSYYPTYAGV